MENPFPQGVVRTIVSSSIIGKIVQRPQFDPVGAHCRDT
jgi:hypothetical protein